MDIESKAPINSPLAPTWEQQWVMKHNPAEFSQGKKVEALFWQDIKNIAPKVLKKITKDGTVTEAQLARAVESKNLTGDEAQVAAALYMGFSDIYHKPAISFGEARIARKDIDATISSSLQVGTQFNVIRDLDDWRKSPSGDTFFKNNSGKIRMSSIENELAKPNCSLTGRASLMELKANFLSVATNGVLGEKDLPHKFDELVNTPQFQLLHNFKLNMRRVDSNQSNPKAQKIFADNDAHSIVSDAVRQGKTGDCSFKAALTGYAAFRPNEVKDHIKIESNGTYSVFMPGFFEKSIQVAKPTDSELGLFNSRINDHGFWPQLFSIAFGKHEYAERVNAFNKNDLDKLTVDEVGGENSSPATAISALTGHTCDERDLKSLSDDELKSLITKAISEKRILVVGTLQGNDLTIDGYRRQHALTVLEATDTNGKFQIKVRDPRNDGKNNPLGESTINLRTLRDNFIKIFSETNKSVWSKS